MSFQKILSYKMVIFSVLIGLQACGGSNSPSSAHQLTSSTRVTTSSQNNFSSSNQQPVSRISYHSITSSSLNMTMGFAVYLPPNYTPESDYPVLYSMYGYGGNQYSMFNGFLSINVTADQMITRGALKPMIIVVPDYKNSFAVNSTREQNPNSGGGTIGLYEDYLIKELIPYIDLHFSTDITRSGRFIEGYSMGGYAALYLGFNYPELFSKIAAHSSALWDYSSSDQFTGQRDWLYTTPDLRARRDPFLLARSQDLRNTEIYLDVGTNDSLFGVNQRFYQHLLTQGIRVEWHTSNGGHTQTYWSSNTENYFFFY